MLSCNFKYRKRKQEEEEEEEEDGTAQWNKTSHLTRCFASSATDRAHALVAIVLRIGVHRKRDPQERPPKRDLGTPL